MPRHSCGICAKGVRTGGILCTGCNQWIHLNCLNLAYSAVRNFSEEEIKTWKCSNCCQTTPEPDNCSSLARELDFALLKENENLRQELHEVKNRSSYFELQLEDDLKQKEEELEAVKKMYEAREKELEGKLKLLEGKLNKEKEINDIIIKQVEEEKLASSGNLNCNTCKIHKEETKNMLSSIRTLETVISILKKENDELQKNMDKFKPTCLTCFPPSIHARQPKPQKDSDAEQNWQEGKHQNRRNPRTKFNLQTSTPAIVLKNSFDVFSDCTSEEEDHEADKTEENESKILKHLLKPKRTKNRKDRIDTAERENRTRQKEDSNQEGGSKKAKMLLCTDSHGRDLTFHINNITKRFDAVGFVKPGGCATQILIDKNIAGEQLKVGDVLLIMAGSNDIARNEAQGALDKITETIEKCPGQQIVLVDLPVRHDLVGWSCVNLEIAKTNSALKELSKQHRNVNLVEVSLADRNFHTRHGQHLNQLGKRWLAGKIIKAVSKASTEEERTSALDCEGDHPIQTVESEKLTPSTDTLSENSPPEARNLGT